MFDRHARLALFVGCIVMILGTVAFRVAAHRLRVFLQKQPIELRDSLRSLPHTLGAWKSVGDDKVLDSATEETLGTAQYLSRLYRLEGGKPWDRLELHLAYYTGGIDLVPHVPDICFVAGGLVPQTQPINYELAIDTSGWRPDPSEPAYQMTEHYNATLGREFTVHLPSGAVRLRTTEFHDERRPDIKIIAGYFFIANNAITPVPEGVKVIAFDPTERFAYYLKVQFTMSMPHDADSQIFLDHATTMLSAVLPEIMRCLPDWPEVERRGEQTEQTPD